MEFAATGAPRPARVSGCPAMRVAGARREGDGRRRRGHEAAQGETWWQPGSGGGREGEEPRSAEAEHLGGLWPLGSWALG
jgi:hypothetical protein